MLPFFHMQEVIREKFPVADNTNYRACRISNEESWLGELSPKLVK
jgi:hypothetical protein